MKHFFDTKINRLVHEILAGEFISTNNRAAVLTTILGSCVSVCLSDKVNGVYGINHFMLPGNINEVAGSNPKYGIGAMDLLIADMVKKGARRQYLEAKVFGAGRVFDNTAFDVAKSNEEFIIRYLDALNIRILAKDLGKDYGRKIIFFCSTGDVYVKKITEYSSTPEGVERERQFFAWLRANTGGVYNG